MIVADFVAGWSQDVGDGSPIWGYADYAATRISDANVFRHTCGEDLTVRLLEIARLQREAAAHNAAYRSLWEVYSYGCADLFKALLAIPEDQRPCIDWVLIIAGVNRVPDGQAWEQCWVMPACVRSAVNFVTVYRGITINGTFTARVIPECCPIRNGVNRPVCTTPPCAAITRGWTDAGNTPVYVNAECFWEGVDHGSIMTLPIVEGALTDVLDRLLGEEMLNAELRIQNEEGQGA